MIFSVLSGDSASQLASEPVVWRVDMVLVQERRKKEREVEEKRLAAERAAEDERRKAAEVSHPHTLADRHTVS